MRSAVASLFSTHSIPLPVWALVLGPGEPSRLSTRASTPPYSGTM